MAHTILYKTPPKHVPFPIFIHEQNKNKYFFSNVHLQTIVLILTKVSPHYMQAISNSILQIYKKNLH